LEWLTNNYLDYSVKLEFISDKSQEGIQFIKGFGGVGGILRYKINFDNFTDDSTNEEDWIWYKQKIK